MYHATDRERTCRLGRRAGNRADRAAALNSPSLHFRFVAGPPLGEGAPAEAVLR